MKCVVIGGCNMDIIGTSFQEIVLYDSNPGSLKVATGGVGRNIAENMARLNLNVSMISAVGNDEFGRLILDKLRLQKINTDRILVSDEFPTSTYLCILDELNELHIAINSMEVIGLVNKDLIMNSIEEDDIILLDGNLSDDTLEYIFSNFNNKIVVDGVSSIKVTKFKKYLSKIYALKLNDFEAKALVEKEDILEIGKELYNQGVQNVFITLGEQGSIYIGDKKECTMKIATDNIKNVTGAGDAFTAGVVYSLINKLTPEETLKFSTYCAHIALGSLETINEEFSLEKVMEMIDND